jgi:hypothetical protein
MKRVAAGFDRARGLRSRQGRTFPPQPRRESPEKMTVVGFHFTFPSVGHVEEDGTKYRLIPSAWNPTV